MDKIIEFGMNKKVTKIVIYINLSKKQKKRGEKNTHTIDSYESSTFSNKIQLKLEQNAVP